MNDPANQTNEFWLLKKTLYGLSRSPHHWYNMITDILKNIGLTPSPHDPCLFSGVIKSPSRLTNLPPDADRKPIHIRIYVDDFVFFSEDPAEEDNFKLAMKDCTGTVRQSLLFSSTLIELSIHVAMKNIEAGFIDLIVESDSSDEESGKKPAALPRVEDIAPIKDTCKALTARGIGARTLATKLSKNYLTELACHQVQTRAFNYTMRYD
jgi:hypothetical protein